MIYVSYDSAEERQNAQEECTAGFTGESCKTPTCENYLCKNHGKCLIHDNKHKCQCLSNYKGDKCEYKKCNDGINCINGKCTSNDNSNDSCQCNTGYSGEECDIFTCEEKNDCVNGICQTFKNGRRCNCLVGFEGPKCDKPSCKGFTCPPYKKCRIVDGTATCVCKNGGTTHDCLKAKCTENMECLNGNKCANYHGGGAGCSCDKGFSGKYCEKIDCTGNLPCLNGGTCLKKETSSKCICLEGYTGNICQYNKCDIKQNCGPFTSDCYNYGENNNTCICYNGFKGEKCEYSSCEKMGCRYESICYMSNGKPECECKPGHKGKFCHNIDCDSGNPCKHGNCVSVDGSNSCKCNEGWEGKLCDEKNCDKINICPPDTKCTYKDDIPNCVCPYMDENSKLVEYENCVRKFVFPKGVCYLNKFGQTKCVCDKGFTGQNCEDQTCDDVDYCKNGGLCLYVDGNKVCNCVKGTYGKTCEIVSEIECNNGKGVFDESKNSVYCQCDVGYAQPNCQFSVKIDDDKKKCQANYCQNDGVCYINNNEKYCTCLNEYTGEKCEYKCPKECKNSRCIMNNMKPECEKEIGKELDKNLTDLITFISPNVTTDKECDNSICNLNGKCFILDEMKFCECSSSYTGVRCEIKCEDECRDSRCILVNNKPQCKGQESENTQPKKMLSKKNLIIGVSVAAGIILIIVLCLALLCSRS